MTRTYKRATNHSLRDSGEMWNKTNGNSSDGDGHQGYAMIQIQNILLRAV